MTRTGIEPAWARLKASLQDHHRTAPCRQSKCVGQELNLHSRRRVGYGHRGLPMPNRRVLFSASSSGGTRTHSILGSSQVPDPAGRLPCKLRELESNQRPPGSEPGVTTNSDCPASFLFSDTCAFAWFASSCGGRSRTCGLVVQSHGFLPTETTPQSANQSARRESNPPCQLGRLVPQPIGHGHSQAEREGVEPSRP